MKKIILFLLLSSSFCLFAQDKEKEIPIPKNPKLPKVENHTGVVKKVFFAMQGDARFVAYQVLWKGQEIVIVDMMSDVPLEKGDPISFMSMTMKIPNAAGGKKNILQFIATPKINLDALKKKK